MTKKTSKVTEKIAKIIFTEQIKQESPENQKIITDFLLKCSVSYVASDMILKLVNELDNSNTKLNEEEKHEKR